MLSVYILFDSFVLINCKTVIGYGSPNKQGTASTHGAPLGEEEVESTKNVLDWQYKKFEIPKAILSKWRFFTISSSCWRMAIICKHVLSDCPT